jgi:hypothetical protein
LSTLISEGLNWLSSISLNKPRSRAIRSAFAVLIGILLVLYGTLTFEFVGDGVVDDEDDDDEKVLVVLLVLLKVGDVDVDDGL